MTIQQLSGIDTEVSQEKYLGYGTVKSKIANAYNRLPLEIQKLQFNQVLQEKLEDEINGIGGRRKKKPKAQKKEERKERKEQRREAFKKNKGLRILFAPVPWLLPLMRRKLKKAGVKLDNPKVVKEVVEKFYKHIVKKQPVNGYDEVLGVGAVSLADVGEAAETTKNLIKKIIDFIKKGVKKIKDKKKKGGKLSKEEQEDLADTEKAEEAEEKEKEDIKKETGGGGMALPLLAAGAAAFFLLKK